MSVITETIPEITALSEPQPCQCRHVSIFTEPPGVPCRERPTRLYVVGCTHEHVKQRWYCASCGTPHGDDYCLECYEADGHLCRVMVTPARAGAVA